MICYGEILKEKVNRGLFYKAGVDIMIYWMNTTMFKATMKVFWFCSGFGLSISFFALKKKH